MIPIKKLHNDYISIENLFGFIASNKDYLCSLGIKIKKRKINQGDDYYYVNGTEYKLKLLDDVVKIQQVYITEDGDDWAQAESYESGYLSFNGKSEKPNKVYDYIINFKSIKREKNIDELLG
jgi:hypothetical protein